MTTSLLILRHGATSRPMHIRVVTHGRRRRAAIARNMARAGWSHGAIARALRLPTPRAVALLESPEGLL